MWCEMRKVCRLAVFPYLSMHRLTVGHQTWRLRRYPMGTPGLLSDSAAIHLPPVPP
jgi:hypothetical protein